MELEAHLDLAARAQATFVELADLAAPSALERDAAIQRFEYSFEATWKAARAFLLARNAVDERTPGSVIRASRVAGLLSDEEAEAVLTMASDRNLSVHVYKEQLATAIFGRLSGHAKLLRAWLAAMQRDTETEAGS